MTTTLRLRPATEQGWRKRRSRRLFLASGLPAAAIAVGLFLGSGTVWPRPTADGEAGASQARATNRYLVSQRLLQARDDEADTPLVHSSPVPPYHEMRVIDGLSYNMATMPAEHSEISWAVTIAAGSRLRFGYTATRGEDGGSGDLGLAIDFLNVDGARQRLWQRSVDSGALEGRVEEAQVELTGIEGSGRLVLKSSVGKGDGGPAPKATVSWYNPRIESPSKRARRNLIIVCIDTLRADRLTPEHMPKTSARTKSAALLTNAYANGPWSLPSITTILTGLVPGEHQAGRRTDLGAAGTTTNYSPTSRPGGIELVIGGRRYRYQMLHPSFWSLQEILADHSFYTAAIHNNGYINYPTRALVGMDHIQQYRQRDAAVGSDAAIRWLEKNQDLDFFLFLHYIDPHQWPAEIPDRLKGVPLDELSAADRKTILATYDRLVAYTDENLDRVFSTLEDLGLDEDTWIILVADHGERFFEDGVVGSHGGGFQESVIHVPLAIWGPHLTAGPRKTRVSLADVVPTALDLLGVPDPQPRRFSGSLRKVLDGRDRSDRTFPSEFVLWSADQAAWIEGPWKLVWSPRASGAELFDLRLNPAKLHDVSASHPQVVDRLRRNLGRHLRRSRQEFLDLTYAETTLDEETRKSLKALGYIQ